MVHEFGLVVIHAIPSIEGTAGADAADCDQGADRRQEEQDSPMGRFEFYGQGLPAVDTLDLKGTLVVVEGADGVGRSTHIGLLKEWLESRGHAVLDTGMTRLASPAKVSKPRKRGTRWVPHHEPLLRDYFADRLENEMIPALRAGFVVLTDRYIYSLMARADDSRRGSQWVKGVYEFALKPDIVVYLRATVDELNDACGADVRLQLLGIRNQPTSG